MLGSAMRLVVRTVTALPPGPDAATRLTTRLVGTRAESVVVPISDDLATPGTLFCPPDRDRFGCVLLLHGTSAWVPLAYLFYIEAIIEAGFGVLHVDLDGHGRHPQPLSGSGLARSSAAAFQWMAEHPAVDDTQLAVMGVSLGGSCALRVAATDPRVRAMTLVATPHSLAMSRRARIREFLGTLNPEGLEGAHRVSPHALLRALRAPIRIAQTEGIDTIDLFHRWTEPVIQAAIDELDPLGAAALAHRVPTLFVGGAWDTIAPTRQADDLARSFTAPTDQLVLRRRNHFTVMTSRVAARRTATWLTEHAKG